MSFDSILAKMAVVAAEENARLKEIEETESVIVTPSAQEQITFDGNRFVVSGKFARFTQGYLTGEIEYRGGTIQKSINTKTTYLVIPTFDGMDASPTGKYNDALSAGVTIIDEAAVYHALFPNLSPKYIIDSTPTYDPDGAIPLALLHEHYAGKEIKTDDYIDYGYRPFADNRIFSPTKKVIISDYVSDDKWGKIKRSGYMKVMDNIKR